MAREVPAYAHLTKCLISMILYRQSGRVLGKVAEALSPDGSTFLVWDLGFAHLENGEIHLLVGTVIGNE